jgi:hypothetical protein
LLAIPLNRKLLLVIVFAICSAGVFAFTSSVTNLTGLYRLARHPAITQGSITGKLPENHRHVSYIFVAGGTSHNAEGAVGDAYETISIGATIPVIYDPKNPDVSRIYDPTHPGQWQLATPEENFIDMFVIISVFSLMGGLMFTLSFWQIAKRSGFLWRGATE